MANALPVGTALTVEDSTSCSLRIRTTQRDRSDSLSPSVHYRTVARRAGIIRLGQDSASPVLTVGSDNSSTTFAGSIIGGGSLVKVGTGTLILSGNGTIDHTDGTTVVEYLLRRDHN